MSAKLTFDFSLLVSFSFSTRESLKLPEEQPSILNHHFQQNFKIFMLNQVPSLQRDHITLITFPLEICKAR